MEVENPNAEPDEYVLGKLNVVQAEPDSRKTDAYKLTDSRKTDAYKLTDSQKTDAYTLTDSQKIDAYEMTGVRKIDEYEMSTEQSDDLSRVHRKLMSSR